ncbi:nitrate/sulfonate/bicarbonate ABC transporter ATP-binding protein [Siccirubricoccus deserti]|uniref:ABC transporter ATP-binding protein n=1 Tax=Siccirubricoccus deserti TaxID=2013562 RepID=A0A9X0QVI4_9PROT|nr:ABC transporter ATP-binding protein [Siccirubricoccus deserti]MBC4014699.1 ABC transporter ATP-binding protein [Siccirubricoccus deserti]GGC34314.1 nitrate/sulfonate/bicarbonate ABC transporter ATP-binding protein [Siccirubricoccus deserti]
MSAAPLVSLRAVAKRYATGTLAVRGVDLDIDAGDFVALLGPSGCGKSTLLRMVAGLAAPTGGSILWPGGAAAAKDIGFVFQEPTLMPWATALANVALPLELAGMGRAEAAERAAAMLARVELKGFEAAYPRALSGGMRMRVSIARALVTRPRLLMMDEPFAALDEITRFRLNNDLLRLWEAERFTVLFVTHSVFESVYLARRIVVMAARPGRIEADLPIDAAYPRGEDFRTSAAYAAHCRGVSQALGHAMAVHAG